MSCKLDNYPIFCDSQNDVKRFNETHGFENKVDVSKLQGSWEEELNSGQVEQYFQEMLEQYPILVPGIDDAHHGPVGSIVVSKYPFGSNFISDFAYATANSAYIRITFVEIEKPDKRIFTKMDEFSADFNHSIMQVTDWKSWCDQNRQYVMNAWQHVISECGYAQQHIVFGCILVFGRRYMTTKSPSTLRRWTDNVSRYEKSDIQIMTYDRLGDNLLTLPNSSFAKNRLVVCRYSDERFVVKHELL